MNRPNHTQISNEFIRHYVYICSKNAIIVFLSICKIGNLVSIDKLLSSGRMTLGDINEALAELMKLNIIKYEMDGLSFLYSVNYVE